MESHETPTTPQRRSVKANRRLGPIFTAVAVLGLAGGISWWMGLGSYLAQRQEYAAKAETFSGSSESLNQTAIVPTLDTPCPPNKNVIWCSSFQLAWNEVRDRVVRAPLEVVGAEEIAARLNAAKESGSDLEAKSYYAAGGWIEKGIINIIKKDMAAKFPSHVPPGFNDYVGGILAYSYLTANVLFRHPFEQTQLAFGDSQAVATRVEAFGVWNLLDRYDKIREQVEILYCRLERDDRHVQECVIDLCKDSTPYQVVVAMVRPKESLAATLADMRLHVDEFKKSTGYKSESQLHKADDLKVPEVFWRIDHRFEELIGKVVRNVDMPIVEAMQTIEFRLDRSGAVLESEARFGISALPREFTFDRPFLIYMQKRGAEHPFFVMWVDNAELLTRK